MGTKTGIEWTATRHEDGTVTPGSTWNFLRGCTPVSLGCKNCYASALAHRFQGPFAGLTVLDEDGVPTFNGTVRLVEKMLDRPYRWADGRRIFVNSVSDLFHADVDPLDLDAAWAIMATTRRHTYQILTKRPDRMATYVNDPGLRARIQRRIDLDLAVLGKSRAGMDATAIDQWPLPNIWLGVSVEDGSRPVTHRIDALIRCQAAVRFLSCEPLIGPLDLTPWLWEEAGPAWAGKNPSPDIDWVIVGGESGPRFRPLDLDWARALRDQCAAARIPYFFKQDSGPRSGMNAILDGQVWHEFPDTRDRRS